MTCRAETRRRVRSALAVLVDRDDVVAADELETDPTGGAVLEVVLDTDCGVPAAVAGLAANHGLAIRSVDPQGPYFVALLADS